MPILRKWTVLLLLWGLVSACASAGGGTESPDSLEARADAVLAKAQSVEPQLTARLVGLVDGLGGELKKLEHRFKTRESLLRKLNKLKHELPPGTPIVIYDALRYTVRCDDSPLGRYVTCVRTVLSALEEDGHQVDRLKNYWERGDNYSGINVVIRAPEDLRWELQFHTSESLVANERNRDRYEELRAVDTSPERKRELYDTMAGEWEKTPIPEGALGSDPLHPKEKRKVYPRP